MQSLARIALGFLAGTEIIQAQERMASRTRLFEEAKRRAATTGRRLVVVGDPDGGAHTRLIRAYDCGDLCVDLTGCPSCAHGVALDITQGRIPLENDRAVVYCSCVLEYVSDPQAAWREMLRIAGSSENIFLVTVQKESLTSILYPDAKWIILRDGSSIRAEPIDPDTKKLIVGSIFAAFGIAL